MGLANRAFKSIWRRKWRTGVAMIAIAIAMAIMISIPAGLNANQTAAVNARDSIQSSLTAMSNEITNMSLVVEVSYGQAGRGVPGDRNTTTPTASTTTSTTTSTITATDVSNISSLDGVVSVVSYIEKTEGMPDMSSFTPGSFTPGSSTTTRTAMNFSAVYSVWGIPTDSTISGLTPTIVSGRAINANETGVMVISESLATSWDLGVGDTKTIEGVTLTIVGICSSTTTSSTSSSTGGSTMSDRVAYVDIAQAQDMYSMEGTYTNLYVNANTTAYAETIALEIESLLSSSTVTTSTERMAQLSSSQTSMTASLASQNATLAQTQATANQETILALVATSAIILLIMVFSVRERVREIGVMKTLGFSNRSIVSQFMLEGLSVTFLGCILGSIVGIIAYPTLSSLLMPGTSASSSTVPGAAAAQTIAVVSSSPEIGMVLIAFVAVLAMGAVGSIYPAWKASRIKPVEALRNE
jgi:putative ABC transport system permease protein